MAEIAEISESNSSESLSSSEGKKKALDKNIKVESVAKSSEDEEVGGEGSMKSLPACYSIHSEEEDRMGELLELSTNLKNSLD